MLGESKIFGKINIYEAYFGAWVRVSKVATQEEPLHEALKPHVYNVEGEPSVPVRLVNRLKKPK